MDTDYEQLLTCIKQSGPMAVAFSGGVDSTLLLKAAHDSLGPDLLAITICAPMHHRQEIEDADSITKTLGVKHIQASIQWKRLGFLANNPSNRCYLCKKFIFSQCLQIAAEHNIKLLADGSTADDLQVHRPGALALKELGVISPLQQTGWSKVMIRSTSRRLDLPTADKPAQSCLLTRFPHDTLVTEEKMRQVELCEKALEKLQFSSIRVRSIGGHARVEVAHNQLAKAAIQKDQITRICLNSGFETAEIDPDGYKSGSMDQ